MLKKLVPAVLIATIGFASAASALNDTGTIASVDTVRDSVTLANGSTFVFDNEDYADRLKSFKPGDQVSISWHHVGTRLEASAISPVQAASLGDPAVQYPSHGIDHLD